MGIGQGLFGKHLSVLLNQCNVGVGVRDPDPGIPVLLMDGDVDLKDPLPVQMLHLDLRFPEVRLYGRDLIRPDSGDHLQAF